MKYKAGDLVLLDGVLAIITAVFGNRFELNGFEYKKINSRNHFSSVFWETSYYYASGITLGKNHKLTRLFYL